jgi:hypothetical protein
MIEIPTGDAIRAALQEQLRELLTAESLGADVAKEIDAVVWLLQLPSKLRQYYLDRVAEITA